MPVIVNAILNDHQIIVDIVAFVNRGDFPRSRLNEKQRGKILAGWVSRKMRTMAQFAIKDMDAAALEQAGPVPDGQGDGGRASFGSLRSSGGPGPGGMGAFPGASSSLRNMEPAPQILEQRELEQQLETLSSYPPMGVAEMPADDRMQHMYGAPPPPHPDADMASDTTPTKARISVAAPPHGFDLPNFDEFTADEPPPPVGPKPAANLGGPGAPQIRLPGVDGRESMDDWRPSSMALSGSTAAGAAQAGGGGDDDDEWQRDAIMHMNLAGDLQRRG